MTLRNVAVKENTMDYYHHYHYCWRNIQFGIVVTLSTFMVTGSYDTTLLVSLNVLFSNLLSQFSSLFPVLYSLIQPRHSKDFSPNFMLPLVSLFNLLFYHISLTVFPNCMFICPNCFILYVLANLTVFTTYFSLISSFVSFLLYTPSWKFLGSLIIPLFFCIRKSSSLFTRLMKHSVSFAYTTTGQITVLNSLNFCRSTQRLSCTLFNVLSVNIFNLECIPWRHQVD